MPTVKLGELLVKAKLLQEHQLKAALAEQKRWGGKLGDILVRMNANFEDVIVRALSKQLNIPIADISALQSLPPEVLKRIPMQSAEQMCVLPLGFRDEGRTLAVAMAEPQNLHQVDTLRALSGCRVVPYIAPKSGIIQGLRRFYGSTIADEPGMGVEEEFEVTRSSGEVAAQRPVQDELDPFLPAAEPVPPRPPAVPAPVPVRTVPAPSAVAVPTPMGKSEALEVRAILELLIDKGLVTREEYQARVKRLLTRRAE